MPISKISNTEGVLKSNINDHKRNLQPHRTPDRVTTLHCPSYGPSVTGEIMVMVTSVTSFGLNGGNDAHSPWLKFVPPMNFNFRLLGQTEEPKDEKLKHFNTRHNTINCQNLTSPSKLGKCDFCGIFSYLTFYPWQRVSFQ